MKKLILLLLLSIGLYVGAAAQNYNNIVNYYLNSTIANGIKITTNMPFTTSSQMPTIVIQGYNYGKGQSIGLVLTYYIFGSPANFTSYSVSSFGSYTPSISLSNESGKVVIFIDDKPYFPRLTVSAFAQGLSADVSANYTGWTVSDAALAGTNTVVVPYKNTFSGTVSMPGTGVWNSSGSVGIGTVHPDQKLTVNGTIHSTEVIVDTNVPPDYVFDKTYDLPTLTEVETYIVKNHHLPEVPSAAEIVKNGQSVGEMNMLLLKKVEELTLYLIANEKKMKEQNERIQKLEKELKNK